MLLTDIQQQSMLKRVGEAVSILMEEEPLFKEDIDYSEIVPHLVKLFQDNLHFEKFNTMSDAELKEICSGIMSVRLLGKISEDFTPEQMAIFDEAIKRK